MSRRRARTLLRAAIIVVAVLCAAVLVMLGVAALEPESVPPEPWAQFWNPTSWVVITLATALACLLGWLVSLPGARRYGTRRLVAIGILGTSAVALAFVSYVECAADAVPFWSPLTWALELFLGVVPDVFGVVEGCAAEPPLALLAARMLVIATVGIGFAAAVAVVFRSQLDVLRMRRSGSRVVVDGPLDVTLPAAERVRTRLDDRTMVVVRADPNDPPPPHPRHPGIVVLRWSETPDVALRIFALRTRPLRSDRIALRGLFLLGPVAGTNLSRFEHLDARLRNVRGERPQHIRAVVRIDDVWVAEFWRRRQVDRPGWALDAVGVYEATAEALVSRWMDDGCDRVAVHGGSDLVLAIAAEAAQRARERAARRRPTGPPPPRVVIVGADASGLLRRHTLHQRAFGNAGADVEALDDADAERGLVTALAGAASPAVMIAPAEDAPVLSPSEIAAAHPGWPVYAQIADGGPIPDEPVMERLYPFAAAIGDLGRPDRWERVARVAHENYLDDHGVDPANPARRPWEQLDDFYRDSNIRLVRETLSSAVAVGRTWGPVPPGADPDDTDPTEAQLDEMARREHESWRARHLAAGWRHGSRRDDVRRTHPLLVPWEKVDEAGRAKTRRAVLDALGLLRAMGYASRPAMGDGEAGEPAWRTYRRRGEVSAERVDESWTWTTTTGSAMQALPGDWRVRDGEREWSVRPPEFADMYEAAGEGRFRRRGSVRATRVSEPQTVQTLEGAAHAEDGDWIVEGENGERWVVPDAHFRQAYESG